MTTQTQQRIVHPLDDAPEQKMFHENLGRIRMTRPVRAALCLLQVYMVLVLGLMLVRVAEMTLA
jgi:hypothetical protein